MSSTVLKAENVGKQYRLGTVGTGTLSHDLNRVWYKLRGKADPYLRVGEQARVATKDSNYVWALQNVSFDVAHGEVLGIIGKNGAGKSTLLKILSRTTSPTTGSVKLKGKVASLLEVGTGFHPELSGRENIFLNGAILGMTKRDINKNFDEIVDFAGVEKYIDTPVKRYSSGMYVRLAFGVAAHLEPEILIVDEVLAVGDAEFQKKALGKMQSVSNKEGRTVLFVSHNMEAVQNLCTKALLLQQGKIISAGQTPQVISDYLRVFVGAKKEVVYSESDAPGNNIVRLLSAKVNLAENNDDEIGSHSRIKFDFEFVLQTDDKLQLDVTYHLTDERGILVYVGSTFWTSNLSFGRGKIFATCIFPENILNEGNYTLSKLLIVQNKGNIVFAFEDVISFDIFPQVRKGFTGWAARKEGVVRPANVKWTLHA